MEGKMISKDRQKPEDLHSEVLQKNTYEQKEQENFTLTKKTE